MGILELALSGVMGVGRKEIGSKAEWGALKRVAGLGHWEG